MQLALDLCMTLNMILMPTNHLRILEANQYRSMMILQPWCHPVYREVVGENRTLLRKLKKLRTLTMKHSPKKYSLDK